MQKIRWLALLVALTWACSPEQTPSPTAETRVPAPPTTAETSTSSLQLSTSLLDGERTLRVGSTAPPTSLDPADAITLPDWETLHAIGEGLLVHPPGSRQVVPGIAEDLPEVSDDGLTYTFRLRPGVMFADGSELTAPGYVESIERVMQLGGRAADLVTSFVDSVEAPDDSTILFHLRDAYAFFPTVVAGATYLPTHLDTFPVDQLQPSPEPPVYGVGPWLIEDYSQTQLVLAPNPHYEANDTGIERIVISYFEAIEPMTSAMAEGELDVIWRGPGSAAESPLTEVEGINLEEVPGGTLHFLTINHAIPPTDDPLVRQALAQLVDRETIAQDVMQGTVESVFSPVSPGLLGATDAFRERYGEPDIAAAVQLLTEAGFTEQNPATLELGYPPERFGIEVTAAMEELARQIESTGLIEVTLTAQPWNTYVGDVVQGAYNLGFLGWLYDFPDPHNYLAPFVLEGGLGGSGETIGDDYPEMLDLMEQAASETDEQHRAQLYREIQHLYAQDVVTLPLWLDHEHVAYWDRVSGDPQLPHPETLNIGPTMQIDYSVLHLSPDNPES